MEQHIREALAPYGAPGGNPEAYVPVTELLDDLGQLKVEDTQRDQFKQETLDLVEDRYGIVIMGDEFVCPKGEHVIKIVELDDQILFSCDNPCNNTKCPLSNKNKTKTKLINLYTLMQVWEPGLKRYEIKEILAKALGVPAIADVGATERIAIKRNSLLKWCQKEEKSLTKQEEALKRLFRNGKTVYYHRRPPKVAENYTHFRPRDLKQALSIGGNAIRLFVYLLMEAETNLARNKSTAISKPFNQIALELKKTPKTIHEWKKQLLELGYLAEEQVSYFRIQAQEHFNDG